VGGGATGWLALPRLYSRRLVRFAPGGLLLLTDKGRNKACSLVRSHRLWELYLRRYFQLPLDHLHSPAERIEHYIDPQLQQRLADALREPASDPHGKPIPPAPAP
jgi:Mn-dependent DtxR family transcriptional regulator